MIDPQMQANSWIRRLGKAQGLNLKTLKVTDSYQRAMEAALIAGATVLLEDAGNELDPGLDPVLTKAVYKEGGLLKINYGDRPLVYDESFRLFITTKLANPHYLPELCIKLTVINFTVTFAGLEEQLLVDVVVNEAPQVEEDRDRQVLAIASCRAELVRLENLIL